MDSLFNTIPTESVTSTTQASLPEKLQKLINNYVDLKDKYEILKKDFEANLTANIELDDEKTQLINEKNHLAQTIVKLSEELKVKEREVVEWKEKYQSINENTIQAVEKIDALLAQCEL